MNSEYARWDASQRQYDSQWGARRPEPSSLPCALPYAFPEPFPQLNDDFQQLQIVKSSRTRTTPVVTRTRISRHGSEPNPIRPSSSGGEVHMVPYQKCSSSRRAGSYSHPTPLEDFRRSRRWPPKGYRLEDALEPAEAEDLICAGASTFKGYRDAIPNAPEGYNRFYAVMEAEHQSRTDRASFQQQAYRDISLNMTGTQDNQFPWLSHEYPCMAYAFGKSAGTTTLNYWVSKSGTSHAPVKFAGDAQPRKIKLLQILDRLQRLENGLNEDVSQQLSAGCFWVPLPNFASSRIPRRCIATCTTRSSKIRNGTTRTAATSGLTSRLLTSLPC